MSSLVVHFEIHASEPQRLIDFYSQLLDWRFERFGEVPYWTIETGEGSRSLTEPGSGINGGLTQREGPAPAPGSPVNGANLVIAVDDADATYARGLELGGTGALPPTDMPQLGRLAYLADPDGNVFGLISTTLSDGTSVMGDEAEPDLERPMHGESVALDPMQSTPEP
ncbi:MAG: VOC family protein [Actinomycetes bacterium]